MGLITEMYRQGERNARNKLWRDNLYSNGHLWGHNERGGKKYDKKEIEEMEESWEYLTKKCKTFEVMIFIQAMKYVFERLYNKAQYWRKNGIFLLLKKFK